MPEAAEPSGSTPPFSSLAMPEGYTRVRWWVSSSIISSKQSASDGTKSKGPKPWVRSADSPVARSMRTMLAGWAVGGLDLRASNENIFIESQVLCCSFQRGRRLAWMVS